MHRVARHLDPDFSRRVLEDLYTYRRKRRWVAWLLWATLGLFGAHRFYLERPFSGIAQLFTAGGAFVWWLVDVGQVDRMVREHNAEQAARERSGRPPVEMSFLPALGEAADPPTPEWVVRWNGRSAARKRLRLAGDLLVLLTAGVGLGAVTFVDGGIEAVVAVVLLALMISLGAGPAWLERIPGFHALVRWTHRMRIFYYYNEPGSPAVLLVRSILGFMWAPFRARDRAEIRLYVELGAAFTAAFLLLDIVSGVVVPMLAEGLAFTPGAFVQAWLAQAFTTFILVYLLAAPVGGVLTLYLLVRPTHTLPRLLAVYTLGAILLGALAGTGVI